MKAKRAKFGVVSLLVALVLLAIASPCGAKTVELRPELVNRTLTVEKGDKVIIHVEEWAAAPLSQSWDVGPLPPFLNLKSSKLSSPKPGGCHGFPFCCFFMPHREQWRHLTFRVTETPAAPQTLTLTKRSEGVQQAPIIVSFRGT